MLDGVTKEVNLLLIIVTLQLVSRGTDYLSGNRKPGLGAFELSDYTPALVWGATCLGAAAVVVLGMVLKSHRVVRDGAVIAMCIYLAFAVVVFDDVFADGVDDWRFFTSYIFAASVWGLLAGSLTLSMAVIGNREEDDGNQ